MDINLHMYIPDVLLYYFAFFVFDVILTRILFKVAKERYLYGILLFNLIALFPVAIWIFTFNWIFAKDVNPIKRYKDLFNTYMSWFRRSKS